MKPPVFFLHAVSTCSLMYGDWLIPALKEDYYTIALDFPCDAGRSGPMSGDATHDCPENNDEVMDWFSDVKHQLITDKTKKVSLVGYSYGSYFSSQIALKMPQEIDKVILMAPAAVFAPLTLGWMWRAMVLGVVPTLLPYPWVQKAMSMWFFGWLMAPGVTMDGKFNDREVELYEASEHVPLQLRILPESLNVTTLRDMNKATPMLLIIGDKEVVIDAHLAIKNAKEAGVATKVYKNAGHLLSDEHPRQPVIDVVKSFLDTGVYKDGDDDDDDAEEQYESNM